MLKAIIFDFDYTLGDSTNGIVLSTNYALRKLGFSSKNISDIKNTIGLSLKETYFALTQNNNPEAAEQFATLFKKKADNVMLDNTFLYTGVKEILQNLKSNGYKTAIVSTKFHYRIKQILEKFSIIELIDVIVGAEDVKTEKPDPEGLFAAIKHLDVLKEEVLYVGDSVVDAKTAANANITFLAVLSGTTTKDDFEKYNCAYIGANIHDIYKYITSYIPCSEL